MPILAQRCFPLGEIDRFVALRTVGHIEIFSVELVRRTASSRQRGQARTGPAFCKVTRFSLVDWARERVLWNVPASRVCARAREQTRVKVAPASKTGISNTGMCARVLRAYTRVDVCRCAPELAARDSKVSPRWSCAPGYIISVTVPRRRPDQWIEPTIPLSIVDRFVIESAYPSDAGLFMSIQRGQGRLY